MLCCQTATWISGCSLCDRSRMTREACCSFSGFLLCAPSQSRDSRSAGAPYLRFTPVNYTLAYLSITPPNPNSCHNKYIHSKQLPQTNRFGNKNEEGRADKIRWLEFKEHMHKGYPRPYLFCKQFHNLHKEFFVFCLCERTYETVLLTESAVPFCLIEQLNRLNVISSGLLKRWIYLMAPCACIPRCTWSCPYWVPQHCSQPPDQGLASLSAPSQPPGGRC